MEKSLCFSCTQALTYTTRSNKTLVRCGWLEKDMIEAVTSCSRYYNKADQSLRDMEQSAYILTTKKKAGFELPQVVFEKNRPGSKFIDIGDD